MNWSTKVNERLHNFQQFTLHTYLRGSEFQKALDSIAAKYMTKIVGASSSPCLTPFVTAKCLIDHTNIIIEHKNQHYIEKRYISDITVKNGNVPQNAGSCTPKCKYDIMMICMKIDHIYRLKLGQ